MKKRLLSLLLIIIVIFTFGSTIYADPQIPPLPYPSPRSIIICPPDIYPDIEE